MLRMDWLFTKWLLIYACYLIELPPNRSALDGISQPSPSHAVLPVLGARHAHSDSLSPLTPRSPHGHPEASPGGLSPVGAPSVEPLTDDALQQLHAQFLAQQAWALGSSAEDDVDVMLQQMLDSSVHVAPARAAIVDDEPVHDVCEDSDDDRLSDEADDWIVGHQPPLQQDVPTPQGFAALLHGHSTRQPQPQPVTQHPVDSALLPADDNVKQHITSPPSSPQHPLPFVNEAAVDTLMTGLTTASGDIDQLLAGLMGRAPPEAEDVEGALDDLLAALPPVPSRRLPQGMSAAAAPALATLEVDRQVQCMVDAAEADLGGLTAELTTGLGLHGSPLLMDTSPLGSPDNAAQLLEDMSSVLLDVQAATGRGYTAPAWHPPPGWQPAMREVR